MYSNKPIAYSQTGPSIIAHDSVEQLSDSRFSHLPIGVLLCIIWLV